MGRTGNLRDYMADIARSNAEGGSGGEGSDNYDVVELTFGTSEDPIDTLNYNVEGTNISFSIDDGFCLNSNYLNNSLLAISIVPSSENATTNYRLRFNSNGSLNENTILAVLKVEDYSYDGNSLYAGKFQILVNNTLYKINAYYTVMAG